MKRLDTVIINGRVRLCYGGTENIALLTNGEPLDLWKVRFMKRENKAPTEEILEKSAIEGYDNRGQAERCMAAMTREGIEYAVPEGGEAA